jgi:hypothetical protein
MSVRVICIDEKNKPKEIPASKWVKEQELYHILMIFYSIPSKTMAYTLEEIDLDESCAPYGVFDAKRFAIHQDDLEEFIELAKNCTELNDIEIKELIEQEEFEIIENE